MRPRHPKKEVEDAVQEAEAAGWMVTISRGHAWGILRCPFGARGGCQMSVWSTPTVPAAHASDIRRRVAKCPH
jgi:hypothetical protein